MQNKSYNTRSIIEAGLTIALVVTIMLMCVYIPAFLIFTNFILPIPIAVLYVRQNLKTALISVCVSAVLMAILYNPVSAVVMSVTMGLTGIVFGYCSKNKKDFTTTIVLLSVAVFISTAVSVLMYIGIMTNKSIYGFINDMILNQLKQSIDINKSIYSELGLPSDELNYIKNAVSQITPQYIMRIIPGTMFIFSVFNGYLNYLIGNSILRKLHYDIVPAKPFANIHVGPKFGTFIGIFLIVGLILAKFNLEGAQYLIDSTSIVFHFMFMIDGISLALFYLKRKSNMSSKLIVFILILTAFIGLYSVYMILGFIDVIADFRKLDSHEVCKK